MFGFEERSIILESSHSWFEHYLFGLSIKDYHFFLLGQSNSLIQLPQLLESLTSNNF